MFTGLAGALEGLTPIIEQVLPLLGQIGPIVGDILADLGPVVADTGQALGVVLVPSLQLFADVLGAIPTEVLSTLLTSLLAFRALRGIQGIFTGLSTSLLDLGTRAGTMDGVSTAAGRLSTAMRLAGPAIAGAFAGIGLAAEDATTQAVSALSATGAIIAGFKTGGVIGGAVATAGVALGGILGKFREGKQRAEELEAAIKQLAQTLETEFPDETELSLGGILGTEALRDVVASLVGEAGVRRSLLDVGVGLDDLTTRLNSSEEEFEQWASTIVRASTTLPGWRTPPPSASRWRTSTRS